MAGFKEQQFHIDGTQYPNVGTSAPAPTTNVTPYKPTAAVTPAGGQALQALGDSLGSFFNSAAQAVNKVADVNAYADRVEIERENKNLELQGAVDFRGGRAMAPEYANRQAYAGAYQQAAAENHAFELAEGFKKVLADQPRDGTQDPMGAAREYWKQQIGAGTGDRDYDARLMGLFTQNVQSMVGAADNQKLQDAEREATNTIKQNFANRLQSQNGFTMGDAADLRGQFLTATHGDTEKADQLMVAIAGTVQNQRQGLSFLNSLSQLEIGKDADGKPVTWAQKNSATYDALSEKVLQQVTRAKSVEAYNALSRWTQDAEALKANPQATAADWFQMLTRAHEVDQRHGVGADKFSAFGADMNQWAKRQGIVNNMFNAMTGATNQSHDLSVYEAESGKGTTDAMRNQAYAMVAQRTPGLEELAASSRQSNGLIINPQFSDLAMQQAADLFSRPDVREAHQGKVMSDDLKVSMFGPITGTDPQAAARSFAGIARMERKIGMLPSGMLSPDQEQMYRSMKAYTLDGTDSVTAFKAMREDPRFQEFIAKGQKSGKFDIADLAGLHGAEAQKLNDALSKGLVGLARENNDLTNIPFFRKDVGMSQSMKADYYALLYKDAIIQLSNGSAYDPKRGLRTVAETMAGRSIVIPGMSGNLQLLENRFGDQGKTTNAPLNVTGPLAVSKGFDPIYAGVPMINKLGQRENPQATFADDLQALAKAFPSAHDGKGLDTQGAWLAAPDSQGLMMLKLRNGRPMEFAPGQAVDLPVNVTRKDWAFGGTKTAVESQRVTLPTDPQEASKFLHDHLPPGWYPVANGYQPPGGTPNFVLHYGFRLRGNDEAAAKASAAAETKRDADNAASVQRQEFRRGVTTEGGAAVGITPGMGIRPGTVTNQGPDADPLTRLGNALEAPGHPGHTPRSGIGGFN